ncbi:unnamed protein product [Rodentolepis nana]|uniref:IRS-type PTB domain-containing protein n=1 Tax=Rodentolepis nana TaxID=102285 RepID=A0A0R3T8H5_RODNA|nr:unnamed protein product [Rodentolepis nana]
MSITRSGYLWQSANKEAKHSASDWIAVNLQISGRPSKLVLIIEPSDPIYETVDEDDRRIRYRVNSFKRCIKSTSNKQDISQQYTNQIKSQPTYQITLQKRRLLKGEEVKIGFNDKASQQLFLIHIREALKENRCLNSHRLNRHAKTKCDKSTNSQTTSDINEIDRFMTENQVYEKHGWSAIKIRVLQTELSQRLQLKGIYLLEIKDCDMCLLDYISTAEINRWPFKYIRSFGFNGQHLYILTGSQCIGGRGLLIFESEKCEDLMNRMICMMKSIAGESESTTENTPSPQISQSNSKLVQPLLKSDSGSTLRNAPPTPTKKSMQDLSASLQDFCRTHCCSLPPLRGRSEVQSAEVVGGTEHETLVGSQAQGLESSRAVSDDNLSLDDDHEDRHKENEEKLSFTVGITENLCSNLNGHGNNSPTNGDSSKELRKMTLRTSSLKKSISEFIAHSMARMESLKPPPPPPLLHNSTDHKDTSNSPQNGDRFPLPPEPRLEDLRTQSLTETHNLGGNNGYDSGLQGEQRQSRRAESAKAVQLIKWRDLPGKEDYYGATNNRLMLGTPNSNSVSDNRGSDLVQSADDQPTESPSMREENSLKSSTSTTREHQLTAALKSDMIAFTSF